MMIDLFVPVVGMVKKISIMSSKIALVQKSRGFTLIWVLGLRIFNFPSFFIPYIEQVNFQSWLEVISHALSLCYNIWFARNKFCFDGEQFHVNDIVGKVWTIT
jgi:hypothetical protein